MKTNQPTNQVDISPVHYIGHTELTSREIEREREREERERGVIDDKVSLLNLGWCSMNLILF